MPEYVSIPHYPENRLLQLQNKVSILGIIKLYCSTYLYKNLMSFYWKRTSCWIALLFCSFSHEAYSSGVSPYLSEKLSPLIENEVERLAVVAGIPNLTRPYSLATIFHYLERVRESHPHLYHRLNNSLKPYTHRFSLTHAKAELRYSDQVHPLPNERGNDTDSLANISLRGQWQVADWFAIYGGTHITGYSGSDNDQNNYQPAGSIISIGVDWAQLDIGYKDYWLSPFQSTSQLLSTHAESMPSISLSNNLPIEFFDIRWNYQIFLAEMSRQPVLFNNEFSDTDKPLIAGFHLGFQPTPWWSFSATRILQFAGGERPLDATTVVKAFFDPRGADNDASVDSESGNQIAALSSKINFDGRLPFSFAVEIAGEDTSNNKSYQLGNTALTVGLNFPYFFSENLSLVYEYSDWQDAWYVNNVYREGYANDGFVLGNWALQGQRLGALAGETTEGNSHFIKTQWQTSFDHIISALVRVSDHEDTANFEYQQGWELEVDYSIPVGTHVLTFGAYTGKDNFGEDFAQFKLSLEW